MATPRQGRHGLWVIAALAAATAVAAGDVLLGAQASSVEVPAGSLREALLVAIGLFGAPALALGIAQAIVGDSLESVLGPGPLGRAREALRDEETDLRTTALVLTTVFLLVLDAGVLYGFVRTAALEMANKRNGALSTALVGAAALPCLLPLALPAYRLMRILARVVPRPRLLLTFGLLAAGGVIVMLLAVLSVDWRIIHFGPWKALGCFLLAEAVLLFLLRRTGSRALTVGLGAVLVVLWLYAVAGLPRFGTEPRARALISEETQGAKWLLKRARGLFDRDGDGYASRLGGGDCDDRDAAVHPGAEDEPGNGKDEDCDGADAVPPPPPEPETKPETKPETRTDQKSDTTQASAGPAPAAAGALWDGNWLIITIDTLRADRINPKTAPNLAKLAERGVLFTNVYAQAPNTPRSFPSFLTSRFPSEVHFVKQSLNFSPLTGRDPTLFTALRGGGVRTIGIFSHFYLDPKTGLGKGFDEYKNDGATNLHDSNSDIAEPRITAAVVSRLQSLGEEAKRDPSRRFALWTHLFGPHSTYMDHPEFPAGKGFRFIKERYDAEVQFTDLYVGKILKALEAAGLSERTAIAVFSDHGEAFGEHKLGGEPLYFHGESLYNEVLKVPLLIYVPGGQASKITPRTVDERAMLVDVAPTLLELSGVPRPESFHGRSLVHLLRGEKTQGPVPPAYAEMLPCTAWQKNERVLVDSIDGTEYAIYAKYTDNLSEIYELGADPTQQKNLAYQAADKVRLFQQKLAPYLRLRPDR